MFAGQYNNISWTPPLDTIAFTGGAASYTLENSQGQALWESLYAAHFGHYGSPHEADLALWRRCLTWTDEASPAVTWFLVIYKDGTFELYKQGGAWSAATTAQLEDLGTWTV